GDVAELRIGPGRRHIDGSGDDHARHALGVERGYRAAGQRRRGGRGGKRAGGERAQADHGVERNKLSSPHGFPPEQGSFLRRLRFSASRQLVVKAKASRMQPSMTPKIAGDDLGAVQDFSGGGLPQIGRLRLSRRVQLTPPAIRAMAAPARSAAVVPRSPNRLNMRAISAAPVVWPRSRAVPSMPLAPPLRSRGADPSIARLLGVWNRPKPKPHSAMRQAISALPGCTGSSDSDNNPAAKTVRPMPPSAPAG